MIAGGAREEGGGDTAYVLLLELSGRSFSVMYGTHYFTDNLFDRRR